MNGRNAGPSVRLALRLLASHHPLCSFFDADVVPVGRVRVCAGCLVMWPPALTTLAASFAWSPLRPSFALAAGLVLGLPYILGAFLRLSRPMTHAFKLVGGIGLGLAVWGFMFVPAPVSWKIAGTFAGTLGLSVLLGMRMRRLTSTCRRCPYAMDWETCPGMLGHPAVLRAPTLVA